MRKGWILRGWPRATLLALGIATSAALPRADAAGPPSGKVERAADAKGRKALQQGRDYVKKMQDSVRRVQRLRDEAKAAGDIIKLNYLNQKLAKITGQLRDAEQALGGLSEALASGNGAEAAFEMSRLDIYAQQVDTLTSEAERAVGADANYVGPNRTSVEVDPTVPGGDPTDPGLPAPTLVMAPPGIEEAASDSPSSNAQRP